MKEKAFCNNAIWQIKPFAGTLPVAFCKGVPLQ